MKPVALFFPFSALVVFVQGLTGAYTVLDFYDFGAHMTSGYVTGLVALVAMILAFTAKPKYTALRYSSVVFFALVVLQGLIGFSAETSDQIVGIHFGNFLVLFGISIAMVFYAFRWSRMGSTAQQQSRSRPRSRVRRTRS
jgi:heme A synthase